MRSCYGRRRLFSMTVMLGAVFAHACEGADGDGIAPLEVTPENHGFFPIATGPHAVECDTCHGGASSFTQFNCLGCHAHEQAVTDILHGSTTGYAYTSPACYTCHPDGAKQMFDHADITGNCASCHEPGAPFAALPVPGFIHPNMNGADCGACHDTQLWAATTAPSGPIADPLRDINVSTAIPTYAGTSIVSLQAQTETLSMPMDHQSTAVVAAAFSACGNCHPNTGAGELYPGDLHASLFNNALAQPTQCIDCHASSVPTGFVGPLATQPARTPPSAEMKHDAVAWTNGAPTGTKLVSTECGACHVPPSAGPPSWAVGPGNTVPARYHASLTAAGEAQPGSCVDCHANSRPPPDVVLTSGNATLPAKLQFDHAADAALGDCATCHTTSPTRWTEWTGGKYHRAGGATPTTCFPCHAEEQPVSTNSWQSPTYTNSPFDYVTNASGITHGAGQDCALCHAGPGTGTWGSTQNWVGGHFSHGPGTLSQTTCLQCHATQRPDLLGVLPSQLPTGFDHARDGTGDCIGCHQDTVGGNRYANLMPLPGGDWRGGIGYPGSTLIGSGSHFVTKTGITLNRDTNNLVTSMSAATLKLTNMMLHDSAQVPAAINPGPEGSPDNTTCVNCHTSTSYADGVFHAALTALALPQPSQCLDCHAQMLPTGIVELAGSDLYSGNDLYPMDHAARFTSTVTLGGSSAAGVADMDCALCHASPGDTWADGAFHSNIGAARPNDCNVCHFPVMADAAKADVTSGVNFKMMHRSGLVTFQSCDTCHTAALNSVSTPIDAAEWSPGGYHARLTGQPGTPTGQPAACIDCHTVSRPATSGQSTVTYSMPKGGTAANGRQWMNHGVPAVVGMDCVVCHASDAKVSGSTWSRSDLLHPYVSNLTTCNGCHGATNGAGTGNNNLPVGLTDSPMLTTASANTQTGVPAGTHDQIDHADINVAGRACVFCHTQVGASTVTGIQGREWAQGSFHANFNAANPLVTNGTTARCSNCHMNVVPNAGFTAFNHQGLSATPGSQDCASCHAWPGGGSPTAPNWHGAPAVVTLPGWSSGSSITSKTVTFAHPRSSTYTSCAQCHVGTTYTAVVDFNHDGLTSSVTINGVPATPNLGTSIYNASTNPTFCVTCHNTGSPYVRVTGLDSTIAANTTNASATVTTSSTGSLTLGMKISGTGIPSTKTTTSTFVGSVTAGSTTVTTTTLVTLTAGTVISGTGIPANDTVAASVTNATSFLLTLPATATATNVTLTATRTSPLTVTIKTIPSATTFTISTAANATTTGTVLTVTHLKITQARTGNHNNSTNLQDCTSCHYVGSNIARLAPPTVGVFATGNISGN